MLYLYLYYFCLTSISPSVKDLLSWLSKTQFYTPCLDSVASTDVKIQRSIAIVKSNLENKLSGKLYMGPCAEILFFNQIFMNFWR